MCSVRLSSASVVAVGGGLMLLGASAVHAQPATFGGTTSGTFGAPISNFAEFPSGVGTSEIRFGADPNDALQTPNVLAFDGGRFFGQDDEAVVLGELTYAKGVTRGGQFPRIPFQLRTAFDNPIGRDVTFDFTFGLRTTPNVTGDPVLDADTLTPIDFASEDFIEVAGEAFTVEILGFSTDNGATIREEFVLPEGQTVTAQLIGKFTANAVPTPSAAAAGVVLLAGLGARRRKATA